MGAVRLLYIEDDDKQRKELANRLRKKGFQVTAARSGETGIAFFEKRAFEAVLCDLNMPGKGGEEVLEAVRERDGDIPFVILSAHGTISQAVKTIKKGADHFILKPADINEITITINQAIERRRLESTLAYANVDLLGVQEDLRKKNEEMESVLKELSKRSRELQIVVDSGPRAILLVDSSGEIQLVNKRIEEYFGVAPDNVRGKSYVDFTRMIKGSFEDPERYLQLVAELEKSPDVSGDVDPHELYERALTVRGGSPLTVSPAAIPVLDENESEIGRVWVYSNVTSLMEADKQVHAIVEASPIPTIISTIDDGKVLFVNEQLASLFGTTPQELLGRSTLDYFYNHEDRTRMIAMLKAEGSVNDFETRIKRVDGTVIWVIFSLVITEISGEKVVLGGLYDISERKKAEATIANRLRYEEGLADFSRTLLTDAGTDDALPEALRCLLKASGAGRVYIFENFEDETDGWCMRKIIEVCAHGVKPQIDNPVLKHLPHSQLNDRWRNLLTSGESIRGLVSTFSDKAKEIFDPQGVLSLLCIPIKVEGQWYGCIGFDEVKSEREWDDEDIRTLQTASEITGIYIERKKFEETLHISEEKFRSLVENANDIIYSLTPRGDFSYISPMVKDIMGYEVSDLLGRPLFQLLHPDDLHDSIEWFKSGFDSRHEHQDGYEFRMLREDGGIRWFTTRASPILDENGDVMELIGVAHDITQMKRVLEEIENANHHLRETQAQLAQSEKMASLGVLVAGIAHEINTPLGAMSSMHDTLMRSIARLKDLVNAYFTPEHDAYPDLQATLDIIDDSDKVITSGTNRVTNIVRRLRSFARLDEAELKTADIHEGLEDTLTLMYHSIKHHIVVRRNYGEIPPIACYPGQLNQVFLNILVNARQAIKDKGEITITTFRENDKAVVKIADTGAGISQDHLSRIFDPGFTTKGVGVGTGLGLAICYNIIQNHKGEITVESEPGKGTTFTIILPTDLHIIQEPEQE